MIEGTMGMVLMYIGKKAMVQQDISLIAVMGASGGSFCIFAIGEMLEMYCNYSATKLQDIVYALLRLSAETADKARLKPNYHCQ